ncbi:MAG: DUF1847 domain-containing protein [Bacteroidales bacterium]
MNCTECTEKKCRKEQESCKKESFDKQTLLGDYRNPINSLIIENASQLVDNGKAGTLSRLEEVLEFSSLMGYKKIGLAYCYGLEKYAVEIEKIILKKGFAATSVSCSIGGIKQSEINKTSCIHKVSCNPIGQAYQLNIENVDLTIIIGLCVGHDILLQRNLQMDFTILIVKDRVFKHNPIEAVKSCIDTKKV